MAHPADGANVLSVHCGLSVSRTADTMRAVAGETRRRGAESFTIMALGVNPVRKLCNRAGDRMTANAQYCGINARRAGARRLDVMRTMAIAARRSVDAATGMCRAGERVYSGRMACGTLRRRKFVVVRKFFAGERSVAIHALEFCVNGRGEAMFVDEHRVFCAAGRALQGLIGVAVVTIGILLCEAHRRQPHQQQ